MNIKAVYTRFKRWQLDPFEYKITSQESHKCHNCGNDFVGNYCPVCSQKRTWDASHGRAWLGV